MGRLEEWHGLSLKYFVPIAWFIMTAHAIPTEVSVTE